MIDPHVLAFAFAGMLVVVTPGLDTALVLRTVAAEGPRAAAAAAIGICTGCLAWGIAASAGLRAARCLERPLHRATGRRAAYLLYLGIRLIVWPRRRMDKSAEHQDRGGWFTRGLLTNILNLKVAEMKAEAEHGSGATNGSPPMPAARRSRHQACARRIPARAKPLCR